MARIFKRGGTYYCWVPKPEGGTRKVSTNCTDKEAAHSRAAELERIAVDPDRAAAAKATLRDALELLIRDRLSAAKAKKRTKSMATVEFYQQKSGILVDGIAAVLRRSPKAIVYLREVTAALVDDYVIQRREDGVLDTTIAKELTTWRSAMRLAKRRGLWPGDIEQVFPKGFGGDYSPGERFLTPVELVKLFRAMVRPTEYRKHGLSEEQVVELRERFKAGDNRKALAQRIGISTATLWKLGTQLEVVEAPVRGHEYFAIVAYVIATGAEPSAVWRAKRSDPAEDLSRCKVWGSKNKYREARDVPLPLVAFRFLLEYAVRHADGDQFLLFPQRHASAFRRTLKEACERAGIPSVSLTDLRRTHGKWLRLSGVAPSAIAPSLGHADGRMTERVYGKATAAELAHVVEAQIAAGGGGLLMGGESGDLGGSGVVSGESELGISPENSGARGRNRTADTGIFNPFCSAENGSGGVNSRTKWAANGLADPVPRTSDQEAEVSRGDVFDPPSSVAGSDRRGVAFQSAHDGRDNPSDTTKCAEEWEAVGSIASSKRRDAGEAEELSEDASHPPVVPAEAAALAPSDVQRLEPIARPGVARVPPGAERVRLEVDGRELVATDVTPGEPVSDAEARLMLAVGQKGGLR